MKADWGLLGGAAAAMLALPLLVLAWSGTPLGTGLPGGTTSDPTPQQSNILPGTDREEPEEPPADALSVLPSFRILDETTGQVAEIPAADYVAGAIAAEMPASYEEDALIAQGMAAYTNAHYLAALRRADPPEELNGADFSADPAKRLGYITDDTMKAMWGDHYKAYREKITKAAEKAMQYLITYEGQPIVAAYFAISAGKTTEDAGNVWEGPLPYLTPADSHWDKEAAGYRSTVTITRRRAAQKTDRPVHPHRTKAGRMAQGPHPQRSRVCHGGAGRRPRADRPAAAHPAGAAQHRLHRGIQKRAFHL